MYVFVSIFKKITIIVWKLCKRFFFFLHLFILIMVVLQVISTQTNIAPKVFQMFMYLCTNETKVWNHLRLNVLFLYDISSVGLLYKSN